MSHYRNGTSWTTADEIDHINHLGTYNLGASRTPRLVWLQRYLDAMPLRADWQKIDSGVVRAEAMRLIAVEQEKGVTCYPVEVRMVRVITKECEVGV